MSGTSGQWSDLAARFGSAIVMLVVGLAAVAAGGHIFHVSAALLCAVMVWELMRMLAPSDGQGALIMGGISGAVGLVAIYAPFGLGLPLLFVPAFLGLTRLRSNRRIYVLYSVLIMVAGFGLMGVRDDFGLIWMLWLVAVVVVTDVAGYFAGRIFGGPKFWPRVSPKKTWSGTVAGWIGAVGVAIVFMVMSNADSVLIGVSVAVAMASQLGDIAESAIKRFVDVKDSSSLIPGHGGVLDRFDGMLGASAFLLVAGPIVGFPPVGV